MVDHDHSYKQLFSHTELVRDLLSGFVQEAWIADLDLSTLEKTNSRVAVPGLALRLS